MFGARRWIAAGLLAAAALGLMPGQAARADERRFTYVYEATTLAPGAFEYEQWVTWKTHKAHDSRFDQIDFRHEIEFGITDRLQASVYLADWGYRDGRSVQDDGAFYQDSAVEVIYNILHPTKDPIGLAVYGEYQGGPDHHAVEGKLILQKNLDRWLIAYNASIEGEWEKEDNEPWEREGEFQQSLGISYEVHPRLTVGVELVHQFDFPNWSSSEEHQLYAGPNVSYRTGRWWITVTPLFQITDVADQPDFQTRIIAGIGF